MRTLIAIPMYNEAKSVVRVLAEVKKYVENGVAEDILVVNDGSTDETPDLLGSYKDILRIDHPTNRGYGAAIASSFNYATFHDYDILITMDCDGQHEPNRIPVLLEAFDRGTAIVSGSRYLRSFRQDTNPPRDRRDINRQITIELNDRFGLNLTDAFCGFKAYCCQALSMFQITESSWGMPLQLWVQASRLRLKIKEIAVPRLYLDANRAFGGTLNDPEVRLAYYREVINRADRDFLPPDLANEDLELSCG